MPDKYRILWVSNSPLLVTGYAKVTREVCTRLASNGHQVFIIGDQYVGQPIPFNGCTLLPRGDSGQDLLFHWVQNINPTHIVFLEDTFTLANQRFHEQPWQSIQAKVILYHPQDGWGVPSTGVPVVEAADHLVAMAKFSAEVVKTELGLPSDIIYHGYDPSIFKPITPEAKAALRKKYNFPEDAFVMSFVGRNSMRKLNQLLLETVVKFLADHPKAYFLGHISNIDDAALNIIDFVKRGIKSRHGSKYDSVIASDRIRFDKAAKSLMMGSTEQDMAEIYQVSDVYVTASSGEGFGMPLVEAMACGIPVVATNYTTTQELVLDGPIPPRGFGVEVQATWTSSFNVDHAIWNIDSALASLHTLYSNPEMQKNMRQACLDYVEANCIWANLVNQWEGVFAKAVKAYDNPERPIQLQHKYVLLVNPTQTPEQHPLIHATISRPVHLVDGTKKIFTKLKADYGIKSFPALVNLDTRVVLYDEKTMQQVIEKLQR